MKSLALSLLLLGSISAWADHDCTAVLETQNGQLLEEFTHRDYSHEYACGNALSACQRAKEDRRHSNPFAQCRLKDSGYGYPDGEYDNDRYPGSGGHRPPPFPGGHDRYNNRCQASLKTRNGQTIQVFYGTGFNYQEACQNAEFQCQQELRERQRNGRNPFAFCSTDQGGGQPGPFPGPGGQMVSCDYGLFDRFSGHQPLRTFSASARGFSYQEAASRACQTAQSFCEQRSNGPQLTCRRLRIY